jgi:predicted ATPase/class 3 adenylate cyclase
VSVPRLPAGTVTFLFTDIEGSTRLWQRQPEGMKTALARHHEILKQAIESSGGYVFQIVGDAFCAAFHTVSAGVGAALAAQRALASEPWSDATPIRVRMAVHTGTAEVHAGEHTSGEYVSGLTLSHAARLLSVGYGGQILVSTAAQQMLHDDGTARVELRDLGVHRLRDIAGAEHIFQVVAPGLPTAFPALASLETVPNNLARQLTSFVGRKREIAEVQRLLAETRLLTLTGPGGSGKTRLALEAASGLLAGYPGGVWMLELAPVTDPALVPQVLATTLGVREEAGRTVLAIAIDHLRTRRALLVLDNCEHLIDACAQLADALLRACQDVKVLASSREPLSLTGEVVFRVPPLSLPDPRQMPPLEHVTDYEAIRLFVDRAVAAKPDFALTEANASVTAKVCERLDGIPLAIELAAARVRTLSIQQIAGHLDERFRLLTGGSRTALPRHQTLRGLIDWSHGLLVDHERALFRRLSAFIGGWTLDAAVAVCAFDGVERHDAVDLLGRLVDKSLVLMDDRDGEARYRMLETIREYGLEKLADSPDEETMRARHSEFWVGFAEAAEPRLQRSEQVAWLARLDDDHDNMRAALRWSLDRDEIEPALRLGAALVPFWDTRGYVREGREWVDALLAKAGASPAQALTTQGRRALAKVFDGAARMRARWSEFADNLDLQTRALQVWRELGDTRGIAEALNNLGDVSRLRGDRARSKEFVEEGLALFRGLGDKRGIAHALILRAELAADEGDHARARSLFEESVPLFEVIQDRRGLSHALVSLGGILTKQGDDRRAETLYSRSLALAEELDDKHAVATALRSLGAAAHHRQDHARARSFYQDSVARFRDMNDSFCLAQTLVGFALAAHEAGDRERAATLSDEGLALLRANDARGELASSLERLGRAVLAHRDVGRAARFFGESLRLSVDAQDASGVATSLEGLARVAEARQRPVIVLRLLAAAETWRQARVVRRADADRSVCDRLAAAARAQLDAAAAEAAWMEGAGTPLEETIACTQELIDSSSP